MKILALDSSGLVASVAIVEDDTLLAEYTVNYKKTHSQTLLPMLNEAGQMIELDLKTVDAIAVAAGPGSFTGLRIGSATAKGLGLALDKPLVHIPTVDALAYNLYGCAGYICPMMDARRNQVYTGIYRFVNGDLCVVEPQAPRAVGDIAEKLNLLGGPVTLLGDGVPVYRDLVQKLLKVPYLFAPAHVNRQRASAVAALAMQYVREGRTETAAEHAPDYLRPSQAERERAEATLSVAEMCPQDVAEVSALEREIFSMPWSEDGFLSSLRSPDSLYLVGRMRKRVVAYCGFLQSFEEADIMNVAVAPEMRSQGIGTYMLRELMRRGRARGVCRYTLEVRQSNDAAICLYRKLGFVSVDRKSVV